MKRMFKYLAGLALVAVAGVAVAQTYSLPSALPLGQTDQVQVIKGGAPQAQSYYVKAGQLAGTYAYQNLGTITTGNTFAVTSGNTLVIAQAAGTLAAVTLTAPANPSDGQQVCFISNQITTALTLTANTGQTVVAGGTALGAAHSPLCWTYQLSNTTWY